MRATDDRPGVRREEACGARRTPRGRCGLLVLGLAIALAACGGPRPLQHRAGAGALGPYSGAVAWDELLFVSGKVGAPGGAFADEARSALRELEAELQRAGATFADLLSVTVYLVDVGEYETFNAVYGELLAPPWPARATVGVAALPGGRRVELSGIARRPPLPADETAPSDGRGYWSVP